MKKIAIFFVMMMICAFVAEAATMNVPFFRNPDGGTTRGVIGLKNVSDTDAVITLTYSSQTRDFGAVSQPFVTFALLANAALAWRPIEDVVAEGIGQAIPNMTIEFINGNGTSCCGSALIESDQSVAGLYQENYDLGTSSRAFAHVLLPEGGPPL